MKKHFLNTTDSYHRYGLSSLSWEVTLSVMLENPQSPCRSILRKSDSFGNLLFDYLCTVLPMDRIHHLVEIGGGYGHLMRDFLKRNNMLSATMIDLSPFLLSQQQETLQEHDVQFIQENFLEINDSVLSDIDLAILNEVIGDFPTACEIPRNTLFDYYEPVDTLLNEVRRIYNSYRIALPVADNFTLNLGAIQALEKLCAAQVPYIYISEHSCEARVPKELAGLLELAVAGDPECIRLKGHDEYTIRFTDLERVATFFGYSSRRGQYLDFVEPVIDQKVAFIMHLGPSRIDRYEIIQQFIEDLAKYEYLILSLPPEKLRS
ncbi:MAG: SAM-dependent methyltransferase [Methanotrichaceae archaeon]|nr:SAM-dependent methyltransferase [Methanotrichaceae archaeon]